MVRRWKTCVSLDARAFISTWLLDDGPFVGKWSPSHFHIAAPETMRKHAGDGLGSYRDQRFTLRALGRPWESCGITSSTAMTVKGHPITRALGDGLRYGSFPDPTQTPLVPGLGTPVALERVPGAQGLQPQGHQNPIGRFPSTLPWHTGAGPERPRQQKPRPEAPVAGTLEGPPAQF